jgi:hypothetical protein
MESGIVAPIIPEVFGFSSQEELKDAWLKGGIGN